MSYAIMTVQRDGELVRKFKCPKCGEWGEIDDDQYHGHVSIHHDVEGYGFHETINLTETAEELTK